MGAMVRPTHCPECSHFKPRVFLQCYMDKIRFRAERCKGIRSGCVSGSNSAHICFPALEYGMTPEGSKLEKERWREREGVCVCGCVWGMGSREERQEMRINTEPGMLGNGIFKGVPGRLLKVETFRQGFLS